MKMHKTNILMRVINTVLAVLLVFSAQPFLAVDAQDSATLIYVSPTGNDESGNGSADLPYATIKKAFSAIDGKVGATVVLTGDVESDNAEAWNKAFDAIDGNEGLITITGKDPVTGEIYKDAHLRYDTPKLEGPFKVEYVTLVPSRSYCFIDTNGFPFTVGAGITNENEKLYIHDGINSAASKVNSVEKTETVIESGSFTTVYMGGAYALSTKDGVKGDCVLTLNGGSVSNLLVGFDKYESKHTAGTIGGDVVITLNGGTVGKINLEKLNDDAIGGAFVIIANNALTSLTFPQYTAPKAKKGEYLIKSSVEGTVSYEGTPGVFSYKCDKNYACYVDGEKVDGGIFEVEPGTHTVTYKREKKEDYMGAYINGFPDETFRPDEKLTRAQAAQIVIKAADITVLDKQSFTSAFSDINSGDWYYPAVAYLEKKGLLPEAWQDEFLPNAYITRGEYLHIINGLLVKFADSVKVSTFSDVTPESTPYYDAITSAAASGCVQGYEDGTFRPDNNLTRAEGVTFVNRYLSRAPSDGASPKFSDMAGHWADGQVLAASSGIDENKWSYGSVPDETVFIIPETAKDAKDYITALYEKSGELSGKAIRKGVDEIAERMKADILNTPNTLEIYGDRVKGTAYYISEKGNDETGDGTEEKPFRTISGLYAKVNLKHGDAVLFERGGVYRGTFSGISGVVYGSYGKGNKPIIMQSKKNYASPELWKETEWENVWVCTEQLMNVGIIGFDHDLQDYSENSYNELYGVTMNKNLFGFKEPSQLCGDLQFYSELNGATDKYGELYVYSKDGNPGKRFASIEIGERVDIFDGGPHDVTIDNLSVKFTGAHGVGFGTCKNLTVTNCVFSWLGGSVLSNNYGSSGKPVNYGNAVEIYGGCSGYHVENNWMYQIYDTAVTHQRAATTGNCIQENIKYTRNLMEYVFWGIEYYNFPPSASQLGGKEDTYTRVTRNVYSEYNLLRLGGYGWGSIVRHRTSQLYWGNTVSDTENCNANYNIFDRAYGNLVGVPENSNEAEDKNIYIQHIGQPLGKLKKAGTVVCDYDAARHIAEDFGDKNAVVILIDPLVEPIVRNIPEGFIGPDALE